VGVELLAQYSGSPQEVVLIHVPSFVMLVSSHLIIVMLSGAICAFAWSGRFQIEFGANGRKPTGGLTVPAAAVFPVTANAAVGATSVQKIATTEAARRRDKRMNSFEFQ
jgi:hypothetical protein